jgi:hypothetical protein
MVFDQSQQNLESLGTDLHGPAAARQQTPADVQLKIVEGVGAMAPFEHRALTI